MKRFAIITLLFGLLPSMLLAAEPKDPVLTRYSRLWTGSPFTSKPPPPGPSEIANPLEDYSLGGISKLSDGYFAILLNRKNPKERVTISPGSASEFEIMSVKWADSWRDTVVTLRKGNVTGSVGFEDKLIAIKQVPRKQPQAKPQAQPGRPKPAGLPGSKPATGARKPRPRVVVPPKPKG